MKRVAFHTLGCKVNAYETEAMQQRMEAAGYTVVPFGEAAEVCIINTCTVTNIADRKSRQMLHKAKKSNPAAIIVAAGCYVESGLADCRADDAVDIVIGNNRKADIAEIIEKYVKEHEAERGGSEAVSCREYVYMTDISKTREYEDMPLSRMENHTRAYIKIQDGCNQFCTYCIIPYTRGRIRSRSLESVVSEVRELAGQGYKEIVLTGIHLSSYGMDLEGSVNLMTVVKALSETDGIERIRLGSLEPRIITEDFLKELSALKKVCPHFHLSLQSGSESVLKRMNRHYTPGEYYEKCCLIRGFYSNPAITTDVITGFPGETIREAEETEEFLRKVNFYEMHVFKYSARSGTKAAAMQGQIPESVKAERSGRLIRLGGEMSKDFRQRLAGEVKSVLFEEKITADGRMYWCGYTPEYVKTALPAEETAEDITGRILNVRMGEMFSDMVKGTLQIN